MAPLSQLSLLALASTVFAVPHAHWEPNHVHHHHQRAAPAYGETSSAAPAPYDPASSAAPVESSAPAPYDPASSAPAVYGSTSEAAPSDPAVYSTVPAVYDPSSTAAPYTSTTDTCEEEGSTVPAVYPSTSDPAPVSSGIPVYGSGSASSAAPVSSSGIPVYGSGSGYPSATGGVAYPTGGHSKPVYSVCTETATNVWGTTTQYSTYVTTSTIWVSAPVPYPSDPAPYPSSPVTPVASAYPSGGWGEGETCVPDVTVTTTEKQTIYVTVGGATPSEVYGGGSTAATSYPATWAVPSEAPTSYPSASPAPPSGGSSGGAYAGKRGLNYNDASLTNMFAGSSHVGWAMNWEATPKGLDSGIPYIPTLWGTDSMWTSVWNQYAEEAISNGAEWFFGFNEPDMPSQANLSPEAAAAAWKQYMEPFAGRVKLVAPAVTSGVGEGLGSSWLQSFLSACSDCTIDAVGQHWYNSNGNDVENFKQHVNEAISVSGKPVWVNEFGAIGSDEEKSAFLEEVMSWMDSNDQVLGYGYYMVSDGLLCNGGAPSAYGETYANYA